MPNTLTDNAEGEDIVPILRGNPEQPRIKSRGHNDLQVAIDSAKRRFTVNVSEEIKRIKTFVDVKSNGYPLFWQNIRPGFNKNLINKKLTCPMNVLHGYNLGKIKYNSPAIPFNEFFIKHPTPSDKKFARRVEDLIEKYSIKLSEYNSSDCDSYDEYICLRHDYDEMIADIQRTSISKNAVSLMSWLINRAFMATPHINRSASQVNSKLYKNRSLLLKTLYDVNPKVFMSCFANPKH